jgi:hypothetical protein
LELLKEKFIGTRLSACLVLKAVGTKKSVPALQKIVSTAPKELSEAAAEALRAIQAREEVK